MKSLQKIVLFLVLGLSLQAQEYKSGFTADSIIKIQKGLRPLPETYLSVNYIQQHLAKFANGVCKFTSAEPTTRVGAPGGTFVMPLYQADSLIRVSGGNIQKLEALLGLGEGQLGQTPYKIVIMAPKNLRMPSGNELGANIFWEPGGHTSGGILEAVIDPIEPTEFIYSIIFK